MPPTAAIQKVCELLSPLPPPVPLRLLDGSIDDSGPEFPHPADDGAVTLDKISAAGNPQPGGNAIGDEAGGIADDRGVPQRHGTNLQQEAQMPICPANDDIAHRAILIEVCGIGRQ